MQNFHNLAIPGSVAPPRPRGDILVRFQAERRQALGRPGKLRLSPARRFLYSTSVVRNNATAQDLVQETFVAAFRNRHPFLAQSILSGFSASGATEGQRGPDSFKVFSG